MRRLGAWRAELDRLLATNEARPGRERLTLLRVVEALRGRGYESGYDAVRRYAHTWQRDQASASAAAFVSLSFAPGEAYQFDWSHEVVLIGGTTVTVKVAHLRLGHSRMLFGRTYPRETQEMVFDAHDRAELAKVPPTKSVESQTRGSRSFAGRARGHLRQSQGGGGCDPCRPRAGLPPVPADVQPLPGRAGCLHAGVGLGKARSRTRSGWCASGFSPRGCGSRATTS